MLCRWPNWILTEVCVFVILNFLSDMFLVRSGYISKSSVKTERKRFLIILAVCLSVGISLQISLSEWRIQTTAIWWLGEQSSLTGTSLAQNASTSWQLAVAFVVCSGATFWLRHRRHEAIQQQAFVFDVGFVCLFPVICSNYQSFYFASRKWSNVSWI